MLKLTSLFGRSSLRLVRCASATAQPTVAPAARCYCTSHDGKKKREGNIAKAKAPKASNKKARITAKLSENKAIKLEEAAHDVAQSLPGDQRQTKADLIGQLRNLAALAEKQKVQGAEEPSQIKNLLAGMNIRPKKHFKSEERRDWGSDATFDESSKDSYQGAKRRGKKPQRRYDSERKPNRLFEASPLNIFTPSENVAAVAESKNLFDTLQHEENERKLRYPASNAFEEMIRFTEEKKTWTFPVNNEHGLDTEAQVGFHEHVFLDHLLTDFPKKGPIRHFMELVIVGLSKNPYITVQQKHEHVAWYKEYFADKYAVVEELMERGAASQQASSQS